MGGLEEEKNGKLLLLDQVQAVNTRKFVFVFGEIDIEALEVASLRVEDHGVNKGGRVRFSLGPGFFPASLDNPTL